MHEANNHYWGTKSSKLRRIAPIKKYIISRIDENQNIKRMCRYYTKTPLLNKGVSYDGKIYDQPDLVDSLCRPVIRDENVSSTATGQIITPCAFSGDVLAERQITIYVHCPRSVFNQHQADGRPSYGNDGLSGKHLFMVDIVYPAELNELESMYQERVTEIACEIADMFDHMYIENSEVEEMVGECRFYLEGEVTDLRLSRSGYMVMSIPLWTSILGARVGREDMGGANKYA